MTLIDNILKFLGSGKKEEVNESPEGFCGNCWGTQEYGGEFYEAIKRENVDINSKNPNRGWIQDYADKHLSGIQLHYENESLVCKKCKFTYRPVK